MTPSMTASLPGAQLHQGYRWEHIFSQKTKKLKLVIMVNETNTKKSDAQRPHVCGPCCLGPIGFHARVRGDKVCLSHGGRLAEREQGTFRNGLVFINRPVKVNEKLCIRVLQEIPSWHGALRVGFTTVPPVASLPLPDFSIPNLTDTPGHWVVPVHESFTRVGSELSFWVSAGGSIYIKNKNMKHKALTGVDISQALWAIIDIYGQTSSIFLLGSKKTKGLCRRKSCPAAECLTLPNVDKPCVEVDNRASSPYTDSSEDDLCVVCFVTEATNFLSCGHRCLCDDCYPRYLQEFHACPLCRERITASSEDIRYVPGGLQH
ncbi:E3 ubiquitin-protein ligase NEURL3 isoform X2 [Echeneis naucrates]|uniref:E3 ubiquitin-protein ligase NEURL3 isoform X2 n=1 Tax=Echeneis naucrates TaxID=173247 RepID=UPI00111351AC|nr:E3 ubiquitin-protein ligase NEURL3-like isoform X2 [Echeneis naucrates]